MLTKILAVLAVAAVIVCAFLWVAGDAARARADAAGQRAEALEGQVTAWQESAVRDALADNFTALARTAGEDRAAAITERQARIEVKYRDRIVEVPAVCPAPDADLLRELAEGAARISATEDRLRSLRRPEGQAAD